MKKTYTIDRRTWSRGRTETGSLLLGPDGRQCCLGFVCEQMGVPREKLANMATPKSLFALHILTLVTPPLELLVKRDDYDDSIVHTSLTSTAMVINDASSITDAEREAWLIELFAEHNVRLVFKN